MRKLRLAAAVSLALATSGAFALGLGDIEMRSALNQPMNAEIVLTSVEPGELDGMIVKLASPEAFAQAGIERGQVLTGLRFLVDGSGAEPVIRITSDTPVVEPFLNFLIEIDWPRGRMVREYTVLLDPPVFMAPSASGSSALGGAASLGGRDDSALVAPAPIVRDGAIIGAESLLVERADVDEPGATTAGAGEIVSLDDLLDAPAESAGEVVSLSDLAQPNSAANAQRDGGFEFDVELIGGDEEVADTAGLAAVPAAPAAPAARSGTIERTVNEGDTLFRIAQGVARDGASVEQTMLALLAANQAAFIDGNINLVRAGAILRVPDATAAQRITRVQAAVEVDRQAGLWQEYRDSRRGAGGTRLAGLPAGTNGGATPDAGETTDGGEEGAGAETLSAGAQTIIDEARQEVRELERLRIVGEDRSGGGTDATAADTDRLDGIEQRLQLAREQLASSRQEAGDLGDQAAELRSTTDNFDALITLRQNDIAALESRLQEARERDEQAMDADTDTDNADAAADGMAEGVASAGDAIAEAGSGDASPTGSAAVDEALDNAGATADEGLEGAAQAGDEAGRSARNALTDAGQALENVELVGDREGATTVAQPEGDASGDDASGDGAPENDEAAIADVPMAGTDEAVLPWYQSLLADPTRLAIAGVGGLALFGALGTLLWRRRRDDAADAWLENEEEVEFLDGDAVDDGATGDLAAGAAAGTAAGAAAGVAAGSSARDQAAAAFGETDEHDGTLDRTLSAGDDPALHTSDQTASELGSLREEALDKDDTVSEVDVYLAYGLHGQAEELLTHAIDRDPNNPVYARKLLDTYHAQGNGEAFEATATAWQARFGGTAHPDWPAIAVMGHELRPESALFAGAEATDGSDGSGGSVEAPAFGEHVDPDDGAGSDTAGFDDELALSLDDAADDGDTDESDLMDQSLDPAFAFDVNDLEATGDFSTVADEFGDDEAVMPAADTPSAVPPMAPAAAGIGAVAAGAAAASMTGIDAPELSGTSAAPAAGAARGSASPLPDLSDEDELSASLADDLTLDLDQLSEELELEGAELLEMPDLTADNDGLMDDASLSTDVDEVDTMMDLAKAYIDMGDRDSASSTLDEILKSGNPDQVTEAETLLRKIS